MNCLFIYLFYYYLLFDKSQGIKNNKLTGNLVIWLLNKKLMNVKKSNLFLEMYTYFSWNFLDRY